MKRDNSLVEKYMEYMAVFDERYRPALDGPYSLIRALGIACAVERGGMLVYLLVSLSVFTSVRDTVNMGRVPTWVLHTAAYLVAYWILRMVDIGGW